MAGMMESGGLTPPAELGGRTLQHAMESTRVSSGERINAGERPGRLEAELGSRGRRLTRQRRVIVRVMDTAQRHLDIDEIYERARKLDHHIHRVTVYRTVDLLKRLGLIDELDLLHIRGDRHTTKATPRANTSTSPACAAGRCANSK